MSFFVHYYFTENAGIPPDQQAYSLPLVVSYSLLIIKFVTVAKGKWPMKAVILIYLLKIPPILPNLFIQNTTQHPKIW